MSDTLISIVTPVFNEAGNLCEFHERLRGCLDPPGLNWEWIAVDDASTDDSPATLRRIARLEPRLRVLTQGGNHGSHAAIFRGLREARGAAAVVLAADLQDPPEITRKLLDEWRTGAVLIWAARTKAAGATVLDRFCSAGYHLAVRGWTGLPTPRFGADCFLAGRTVLEEITRWDDCGPSLFLRLLSLPVRQRSIPHERQPRTRGRSGWTPAKKWKFAVSSIAAFTSRRSWLLRARDFAWRIGQAAAAPGASRAIDRLVREWLNAHRTSGEHLDVGCGSRSRLDAMAIRPVGVDADAARIALFRSRGGDGVAASSNALPFAAESFSVVWSFGLLHHLDDAALNTSLAEMLRVTEAGGWVVVFDAVAPQSPWRRPLAALVRALDMGLYQRTEDRLRTLLAKQGAWDCRRVTYSWNGLEAIFCTQGKPTGL